jgi:DNA-binding MarR family transcriptional regulator
MKPRILFLLIFLTPLQFVAADQATVDAQINRLKSMSIVERERLNRNIENFQSLSDSEKQHYREMHRELADDARLNGGLSTLLRTYSVWLQTLTPSQRDDLEKEPVVAKRLALIRQFKEENERSHETPSSTSDVHHEENISPTQPKGFGGLEMKPKDINAVMKILVDGLSKEMTRPEFTSPGLNEYLPIINASVQESGNDYREWPNEKLLTTVIGAVSKENQGTMLKSGSRRDAFVRSLLLGVFVQARSQVPFPTDDDKWRIVMALNEEEKKKVLSSPKAQREEFLKQKFADESGEAAKTARKNFVNMRRQVIELFGRFEVRPPLQLQPRPGAAKARPQKPDAKNENPR